jgi:uncharacterized protein with beta-barrel porin domain
MRNKGKSMRTSQKRYLRYLGAGMAGSLLCYPAYGGDLTVSAARTTPATTSNGDSAGAGNVTVTSAGSVAVTSGAAVTLSSNHNVINAGMISNSGESNATGILISTAQNITGSVTHNGAINIPGAATTSALYPAFVNNVGIAVGGADIYNGSITLGSGSAVAVGGNGAIGVSVASQVNGSITNGGTITIVRQSSFGISTAAAVSGDMVNTGSIQMQGQGSVGIYTGANVGGAVINRGTIVSGRLAGTDTAGAAITAVRGAPSILVARNVGGILLDGNGLTTAQEADGIPDGATADSNLKSYGGLEALSITQGSTAGNTNIIVGALASDPSGASLLVRGNISSEAAAVAVRAVNISGTTTYTTTLAGSITNAGGNISAIGTNSQAQAIRIGNGATAGLLINSGEILARGADSTEDAATGSPGAGGGDAYGVIVEANGSLASITNSGNILGDSHGSTQSGYAILDYSGTLRTIKNSGTISGSVHGSGAAVAFDLSKSTGAVQVTNTGAIIGEMRFGNSSSTLTAKGGSLVGGLVGGTGNDSFTLTNTSLFGNIFLSDGANTVSLVNTSLIGGVTLGSAGTASVNISGSTVDIPTLTGITATQVTIGGNSTITFNINTATATASRIKAQNVVIDGSTTIRTTFSGSAIDEFTANLIEANSLTLGTGLKAIQPSSSIMFKRSIALSSASPNILQYKISRQNATQLGLAGNIATIYENSIGAIAQDVSLGPVLSNMTDRTNFENSFSALIPDLSNGTRLAALEGQRQAQVAIRRRLSGFPHDDLSPLGNYDPSFWVQEYNTFGQDKGEGATNGFRLSSYGLALGADANLSDNGQIGISISHSRNSAATQHSASGPTHLSMTSVDFYGRQNFSLGYLQGIFGMGYDKYTNRRVVTVDTSTRDTLGLWAGNHWGGSLEAGSSYVLGEATVLTGYVRGSYFDVYEHTYAETGGGEAVNLRYKSRSNTSARAAIGATVDHGFELGTFTTLKVGVNGEFARELDNSATIVTARFTAAGNLFTMTGIAPSASIVHAGATTALQFRNSAVTLDYGLEKAGTYTGHSVALSFRMKF